MIFPDCYVQFYAVDPIVNNIQDKETAYKIVGGARYSVPETVYNGNSITHCTWPEIDLAKARVGFPSAL